MGAAGRALWGLGRGERGIDGSQVAMESHRCEVRDPTRLLASCAAAQPDAIQPAEVQAGRPGSQE